MKNPIAYLKHLVKDPITTMAEADARKKEIMPVLYASLGVLAVGFILQVAVGLDFMAVVTGIGVIGAAFCGFLLFVIGKAKTKFAALTCDSCNTMLDIHTVEEFGKYVSYEILKDTTKFDLSHPSSNNGVVSYVRAKGDGNAVLNVSFVCPKCGKTKSFQYSITPFKCQREEKNVRVADVELVKTKLESSVRAVLKLYETEDRSKIPYTIQSIHHPNYANRSKPQVGLGPDFEGVTIRYHRDIDEMVVGLFINNELNGTITTKK